jgi:hypothetical protein
LLVVVVVIVAVCVDLLLSSSLLLLLLLLLLLSLVVIFVDVVVVLTSHSPANAADMTPSPFVVTPQYLRSLTLQNVKGEKIVLDVCPCLAVFIICVLRNVFSFSFFSFHFFFHAASHVQDDNIDHLDEIVLDESQLNDILSSFLDRRDFVLERFVDQYVQ